ncbi:MAG: YkgJ family cysteine cluster protein [Nanoarchaeota archaeon]
MACSQCGICCRLFLINLSEEEYGSKRYITMFDEFVEDFEEAEMIGANILAQKEDGSCVYLKNDKCSIHDDKPNSCKKFSCDSKEERFQSMIEKIDNKKI